jgi:hypothetical protein
MQNQVDRLEIGLEIENYQKKKGLDFTLSP